MALCADMGKLVFNAIVQLKQLGQSIDMDIAVFDEQQMEAVTGIHDIIRSQFSYFFCVELLHFRIAPACTPNKMCTTIIA